MNNCKLPTYGIVQKKKCRGSKIWYGWCRRNGNTTYISLKTENKKIAQEWKDRMNAARFFNGVSLWGMQSSIDLDRSIEEYVNAPTHKSNSSKTIYNHLKKFSDYCRERDIFDLSAVGTAEAEGFVTYLAEKGYSRIDQFVVSASSMITRAYRKEGIDRVSPFKGVDIPKPHRKEKTAWTDIEVDSIIEATDNPIYKMLWSLMAYAGLRIHEALKFTPDDIRGDCFVVDGKGNKVVELPIGSKLKAALDAYTGDWPLSITSSSSNRALHSIAKSLNLRDGSNHTLRHSFCTDMATRNVNVAVAQKLMRHSSSRLTLDIYTHVVPEELKKAVQIKNSGAATPEKST